MFQYLNFGSFLNIFIFPLVGLALNIWWNIRDKGKE